MRLSSRMISSKLTPPRPGLRKSQPRRHPRQPPQLWRPSWQGIDSVEFLRAFPDRVYHMHVKDAIVTLNDGSVRFVSQNIDMRTYQHLGCRHDGMGVSVP